MPDISRLLTMKGSELAQLFGADTPAVESRRGFFPIFNHKGGIGNFDYLLGMLYTH